ncbi:pH-response regulator protein palI/RIM9 [Spathaspora sp. JA1]|nr:pH-response regulator protein palI/RIM9 [Spathaspora sp. JA1]
MEEMFKSLLTLLCLSLVCWVIQLLPVISVPITSTNSNIYLSKFQNYTYGVFGICQGKICSSPRIGYPSANSTFYALQEGGPGPTVGPAPGSRGVGSARVGGSTLAGVILPSNVTYTVSKLLIVHILAFCFTCLLIIIIISLLVIHICNKRRRTNNKQEPGKSKSNVGINLMLVSSLFSFLTNLLGFLVDLLLFTPNLSYLGWIQLLPIVSMVLITTLLCFNKRRITSRRFFENDDGTYYANDDMRMMRKNVIDRFYNDNSSDDGFYVVTDGFYTRNNNNNDNSEEFSLDSLTERRS